MKIIQPFFLSLLLLLSVFFVQAQTLPTNIAEEIQLRIKLLQNDSLLDVEKEDFTVEPNETSLSKVAAERGEKAWLLDSTYTFDLKDNQWLADERYVNLTRDWNGNKTTSLFSIADSSGFVNNQHFEWTYHDSATVQDYKELSWNMEMKKWEPAEKKTYDEDGNLIFFEKLYDNPDGLTYLLGYQSALSYTEDGFLWKEEEKVILNPDTVMRNHAVIKHTPDTNGFRKRTVVNVWNNESNQYDLTEDSTVYEYTATGLLLKETKFNANEESSVRKKYTRRTYEYNNNGAIELYLFEYWREELGEWRNSSRDRYSYDSNNRLSAEYSDNWNIEQEEWINSSINEYTYDDEGNMLSWQLIINYTEVPDKWLDLYTYDDKNNLIEEIHQWWYSEQWENKSRRLYTYSDEGYLQEELRQRWRRSTMDWTFLNTKKVYYYSLQELNPEGGPTDQHISIIFPNPSDGVFNFRYSKPASEALPYELLDSSGKVIRKGMLPRNTKQIDLSGFATGTYFLVLPEKESHKLLLR